MRMRFSLTLLATLLLVLGARGTVRAGKPTVGTPCIQCHKAEAGVVRGALGSRSEKFSTINVHVGDLVWVIRYDNSTAVIGADSISAIPKGKDVAVAFTGSVKTARAVSISVKQPYKVPEGQRATIEYMKEMVSKGPQAGGYLLIDARPTPAYLEGHMPGAVSMPYAAFDNMHARILPEDRNRLLIFYCGGYT